MSTVVEGDYAGDEEIEAEMQQQIESVDVPISLPDKAVCIQIHTGDAIVESVCFTEFFSHISQKLRILCTFLCDATECRSPTKCF